MNCSELFWVALSCSVLLWLALGCHGLLWNELGWSRLLRAVLIALGCSGLLWTVLGCSVDFFVWLISRFYGRWSIAERIVGLDAV